MLQYKVEYIKVSELEQRINAFAIEGFALHTASSTTLQPPMMVCIFEKEHKEAKPTRKKQAILG